MGGVDGVLASIAEYYSGSEEGGGEENGEETSEKETASPLLFRIGFLALFPVVVLLTAFSVLILSGLLIVLCVFTAAAGVLIPATAISGGALSLYALLSGVRLSFSSVPAGLFEIGIGLCAISLTLILSNLLFQAAFRLFPFLMKRILASFRTGADKAFAFISARWNGKEPDKGRREEV